MGELRREGKLRLKEDLPQATLDEHQAKLQRWVTMRLGAEPYRSTVPPWEYTE
jgi:hypothetical protein